MTIPEILLMLAEMAAAHTVVTSPYNLSNQRKAELEWQAALKRGSGAAQVYRDRIQPLHEWRKDEIAKAVSKVRAGFGIQLSGISG